MAAQISQLFEEYVASERLEENSIYTKKGMINHFIRTFGDLDPKVVDAKMAEDYKSLLCRGKLKASSINDYISNIRPFFGWLQRRKKITENPFIDIKLLKSEKKVHRAYTPEEIARIFDVMKNHTHSQCLRIAFTLALLGMRKGEVFNMVAKDFSVLPDGSGEIKISHKEDSNLTWRWGTKGKAERYVPVPEWAKEILLNRINWLIPPNPYLAVPDCYYKRAMARLESGRFTRYDRQCAYVNFYRDFRDVLKRACVAGKTLHTTRFTLCMNLHANNVPIEEAQKILGHAHISTTLNSYMELDQRKLCRDASKHLEHYITNHVL